MNELSVKENDLLERVKAKPELRILFLRKVKGLKWFNALEQLGYFNAKNIPAPTPAEEEGYVSIPRWEVLDYLVKTAQELEGQRAIEYAPKFMKIIVDATAYAKANSFGNYHVWWQFAEILLQVPTEYVLPNHLCVVDYWLDDQYDRGRVTEVIGVKWISRLLEGADDHSLTLSQRLLEILFDVGFSTEELAGRSRKKAYIRLDYHRAEKVVKKISYLAGIRLGEKATLVFQSKLEEVLGELENDTWSVIWQPAVENHEQNKYMRNAENILLEAYRDALCGYMDKSPAEAYGYVQSLLENPYQTIERVAIYCIGKHFQHCSPITDKLLADKYFQANYRHEIWHFLTQNYNAFSEAQKQVVLTLIQSKMKTDENGLVRDGATAYEKATWLAAIKDFGLEEEKLYQEAIRIAKTEPDHPDFSSYSTSGWVGKQSPYSIDELSALSINSLVDTLINYRPGDGWREPGIAGLAEAIKQIFKSAPLKYCSELSQFLHIDIAYIYSIVEAYRELWSEKAPLPWDDIWHYLLTYLDDILSQDNFWDPVNAKRRDEFVANRFWVVGAVARFLELGAKSDDHAFPDIYHDRVESILKVLLEREKGDKFEVDSDAVSLSINSPRGKCIEALINLTLRECRLDDRLNNGNHHKAWAHYCSYFDDELTRGESGEYEFATLVTNYLPNFMYMSKEWVLNNLSRIFDQTECIKWACAMQGYSYVNIVFQDIYNFLKGHGDYLKALDDISIKDRVENRFVQHIAIAYINDIESLKDEDSLINTLLERDVFDEVQHLIWFIWALRNDDDKKLKKKVYELWPLLVDKFNFKRKEHRKLASVLCLWAVFVDQIDENNIGLLDAIAPYADESHNSYDFLMSLAKLSEEQPFEATKLWKRMLEGSAADYPEEAISELLANLIRTGNEGIREAREVVSLYLQKGLTRPSDLLKAINNS